MVWINAFEDTQQYQNKCFSKVWLACFHFPKMSLAMTTIACLSAAHGVISP